MKIYIDKIEALIFDFDGVITNNLVYVDQNGIELVTCSRSDGLAFDALRKLNKPCFIVSTENNPIVTARANKLKVPAIQGVRNKTDVIRALACKNNFDLKNILYIGNDLNDFHVMKVCGHSVCPADSHPRIKEISDIILKTNGGEGVVRCLLENILNLDLVKILYEN